MKVYNYHNGYNLSILDDLFVIKVSWLYKTYPSSVLIRLLDNGFVWSEREDCWQGDKTVDVCDSLDDIINYAEIRRIKEHNGASIRYNMDDIRAKENESVFFNTLKSKDDYKVLLDNLIRDNNYLTAVCYPDMYNSK